MLRSVLPFRPLAGLLLLAAQLAVFAAWQPLEVSHRAGQASGSHVERLGGTDCPPSHDEARCQLCQTITLRTPASAGALPVGPGTITHVALRAPQHAPRRFRASARRSRAPPTRSI